jgi:hypothetical protein
MLRVPIIILNASCLLSFACGSLVYLVDVYIASIISLYSLHGMSCRFDQLYGHATAFAKENLLVLEVFSD